MSEKSERVDKLIFIYSTKNFFVALKSLFTKLIFEIREPNVVAG